MPAAVGGLVYCDGTCLLLFAVVGLELFAVYLLVFVFVFEGMESRRQCNVGWFTCDRAGLDSKKKDPGVL